MNTYDCDTFGSSGQCFSIGGRSISVNNPKIRYKWFSIGLWQKTIGSI